MGIKFRSGLLSVIISSLFSFQSLAQTTIYVKVDGTGDGSSWDNALPGSQLATSLSTAANSTNFYIAEGIYKPTLGTDRTSTFELRVGVKLYGGFPGNLTGTVNNLSLQNRDLYVTRLSGDIGVADVNTDNCYNVVRVTGATGTLLDGFYISDGYGVGTNGAGVFAQNSLVAIVSNSVIEKNTTENIPSGSSTVGGSGAGIYVARELQLSDVIVRNNYAHTNGGGVYTTTLKISNSTVSDNTAINAGAGLIVSSSFTPEGDVVVERNKSTSTSGHGGGIYFALVTINTDNLTSLIIRNNTGYNGGGICFNGKGSSIIDGTNCSIIISDNIGNAGGGISSNANLTLRNVTIENNRVTTTGGGISTVADLIVENSTIKNNATTSGTGGGIHSTSTTILTNVALKGNSSKSNGGGIYTTGILTLTNDSIIGNKAGFDVPTQAYTGTNHGGGVYGGNELRLVGSNVFKLNKTNSDGGAIYKSAGTPLISTSLTSLVVSQNETNSGNGGGIYSAVAMNITDNALFSENIAAANGGAIYSTAPLTLNNTTISENKSITASTGSTGGGGIYVTNTLTLKGTVIFEKNSATQYAGGIYKKGTAAFTTTELTSFIVNANKSVNGGSGIYTEAPLTLTAANDAVITNNIATGGTLGGGGILTYGNNTSLNLTGVKISNNVSSSFGGGIKSTGVTVLKDVLLSNNSARTSGGGIYAERELTLENDSIINNKGGWNATTGIYTFGAANQGGGVFSNNSLTLKGNLVFEKDSIAGDGGALFKSATGNFDLSGLVSLKITDNVAGVNSPTAGNGGGIYTAANLSLSGNGIIITNNKAGNGGGVYAANALALDSLSILNNTASTDGGGVFAVGNFTSNATTFAGNKAQNGGAIETSSQQNYTTITNSTFSQNTAANRGGAMNSTHIDDFITVALSSFNGNTAGGNQGNAIYFSSPNNKVLNGNIIYGNGVSGTEINNANSSLSSYNVVKNSLSGNTNLIVGDNQLGEIFQDIAGDGSAQLKNNGGSTQTLLIKHGGYAHNYIPPGLLNTWVTGITKDQRGESRIFGCNMDAGSVELQELDSIPEIIFKRKVLCERDTVILDSLVSYTNYIKENSITFYADNSYLTLLPDTITASPNQSTIYVRYITTSNCIADNEFALIVNPAPRLPIASNPQSFCVNATLNDIVIDNSIVAANDYWFTDEKGGLPLDFDTPLVDGTTYYVSRTSPIGCTSLRIPVSVILQSAASVSASADNPFLCNSATTNFTLHADVTGYSPISFYRWEKLNPVSGEYEVIPAGKLSPSPELGVDVDQIPVTTYYPADEDYDAAGNIHVRVRLNAGACGYLTDELTLSKDIKPSTGEIEIIEQPVVPQSACEETEYILQVNATGEGGLSGIVVTMNDWKSTGLKVTGAQYQYPVTANPQTGTWKNMTPTAQTTLEYFPYEIPEADDIKLLEGDSLLVRFTVRPGCEFFAGSDLLFLLDGYGYCHIDPIPRTQVQTDIFHLDFGIQNLAEYTLSSLINGQNELTVTNASNPTNTWEATISSNGTPDLNSEAIYFLIPKGMNLIGGTLTDNTNYYQSNGIVPVITADDEKGKEYKLPLPPGTKNAPVTIQFQFEVTTAALCNTIPLYMEIIHQADLVCVDPIENENTPCTFYETLAGSYPEVTIQWYQLRLAGNQGTSRGHILNGEWTGSVMLEALTDIPAGTQIPIDFYVDTNNNASVDAGDELVNSITYTLSQPLLANNTLQIELNTPIELKPGKALIAYTPGESLLCESLTFPIVPLFGQGSVCEGDTIVFNTTPYPNTDISAYSFGVTDAVSGATPKRISAEANGTNWQLDENKSVAKVIVGSGSFTIYTQYRIQGGNQSLNPTDMRVTVYREPKLEYTSINSTSICSGEEVDLSLWIRDTVSTHLNNTWYYYTKESDGSYTLLEDSLVSPTTTTTYGVSAISEQGCSFSSILDFTVNVKPLPTGVITGSNTICSRISIPYGIGTTENTSQWSYNWTITGTSNSIINSTTAVPTVTWKENGIVAVAITNAASGCTSKNSLSVSVNPLPQVTNLNTTNSGCGEAPKVTIDFTLAGVNTNFSYSLNDIDYIPLSAGDIIGTNQVSLTFNTLSGNQFLYIRNNNGCKSEPVQFTAGPYAPSEATWIAGGAPSDWNDANNWDNGVPGACTYVTIPGGLSFYPVLSGSTVPRAECDTIEFKFGGEVQRTDLLSYNHAKVELKVNTFQWYGLSAPLRNMYSGDYLFERINPLAFVRVYETETPPSGGATSSQWTTPFPNTNYQLAAGMGFGYQVGTVYYTAFKPNPDDGAVSASRSDILNAEQQFPKNTMLFNFYNEVSKKLQPKTETIPAGGRTYGGRFIYETGNNIIPNDPLLEIPTHRTAGGQTVIVGNPFMSHLDFAEFYNQNKAFIIPEYKILTAGEQYITFSGIDTNGDGFIDSNGVTDNDLTVSSIAPMQSFIVTTQGSYSAGNLKFTKAMSVTNPNAGLRSSMPSYKGSLKIDVANGVSSTQSVVLLSDDFKDHYLVGEDSRRMIPKEITTAPSVFTITDNMYLDVNRMQGMPEVLPIGLTTSHTGMTCMSMSGLNSISKSYDLSFKDALTGEITPLDEEDNFEYCFINEEGNQLGRFYLLAEKKEGGSTKIEPVNQEEQNNLSIYLFDHRLYVVSADGSPIEQLVIYQLDGRILSRYDRTGLSRMEINVPETSSILIVKAHTKNVMKTVKVISSAKR